jgi:cell wall-associated NlpC family hydrolase
VRLHARRVVVAAVLGLATLVTTAVLPTSAVPSKSIQQVQAELADLQMKAASATEKYSEAQIKWRDTQQKLGRIRNRVDKERANLAVARASIDDLARGVYMTGGIDNSLQVLLADNPNDFIAQSSALQMVAKAQTDRLRRNQTAQVRLAASESTLADQEKIAKSVRNDMDAAKRDADARVADTQRLLASLQEAERRRLAALEILQRQQSAAAAARARAALAAANVQLPSSVDGASSAGGGFVGGSRTAVALRYALSQVGKPYSFSASPPSSWDCSKLTAAAWGQAGVGLTPLSFVQWNQVRRIPVSQIQPGDLVFYFRYGAHHVAMYIGNGKMVSASNPGVGVEITNFLGPWWDSRFSGVGRVLG